MKQIFQAAIERPLAGRTPFAGPTTSDVLAAILKTEPVPFSRCAPEAPAELEQIVSKALRKDPEERYQIVKELLIDLRSLKHHLEFAAELERSKEPATSGAASSAVSSGQSAVAAEEAATRSGEMAAAHLRSSASGFIVEIKHHISNSRSSLISATFPAG